MALRDQVHAWHFAIMCTHVALCNHVHACGTLGPDVCMVVLDLVRAWRPGVEGLRAHLALPACAAVA